MNIWLLPCSFCEKFVQLMLHFHLLRSPWRQVDVFQYSLSPRKVVCKHRQTGEVKTLLTKPLQRIYGKATSFCYFQLFTIRISWEFRQFSLSLMSFWQIWTINTIGNCLSDAYRKYCLPLSHQVRKLGQYFDLRNISWYNSKIQWLLY